MAYLMRINIGNEMKNINQDVVFVQVKFNYVNFRVNLRM